MQGTAADAEIETLINALPCFSLQAHHVLSPAYSTGLGKASVPQKVPVHPANAERDNGTSRAALPGQPSPSCASRDRTAVPAFSLPFAF